MSLRCFALIKVFYVYNNICSIVLYNLYELYKNSEKIMIIVLIQLCGFKRGSIKRLLEEVLSISVI